MSSVYEYRPKFIRGRDDDRAREPGDIACDHMGCNRVGGHRAPKSRERANEYWHFCQEHASQYNRRWNYFSGMSDSELDEFQKAAEYGHRPTWTFRAAKTDRLSAAMRNFQGGKRADAFNLFGRDGQVKQAPRERKLTRLQLISLEALALEETATAADIRARYAELVKRYHPDVNGGDRASEESLERVIRAYQTLKSGGLA